MCKRSLCLPQLIHAKTYIQCNSDQAEVRIQLVVIMSLQSLDLKFYTKHWSLGTAWLPRIQQLGYNKTSQTTISRFHFLFIHGLLHFSGFCNLFDSLFVSLHLVQRSFYSGIRSKATEQYIQKWAGESLRKHCTVFLSLCFENEVWSDTLFEESHS